MERSAFFNSVNNDRVYNAQSFAEYFASFIANGVFPNPSNNLQVFAYDGFQLRVSPGKAWINGYFYVNDDDLYITLDLPDAVLSRIDAVVLRYSLADRNIKVAVKKGAFSSSPTPPTLQRDASIYELCLAQVYVAAGATSITQADITDTRLSTELCGIVHAVVDQVDTTTLFNQYLSWYQQTTTDAEADIEVMKQQFEQDFNTWFATIQSILDENTAMQLQSQIDSLSSSLSSHASARQVHGVGEGYYIAKTSRSDQLPTWSDIQSKPSSFTPSKHASTHKTGGTDVITPADIGAAPVSHTHSGADITSAVAFANDADKLDGYQAADFALAKLNPYIIRIKRSNPDAYGNYLQVDYYRKDGTLFARSVLSGGTPPQYTTRTITIYDADGTTVVDSYTFTITYDANGNPVDEW